MGLLFDVHTHTRRFSPCSRIDEQELVLRAVQAGLDGLVITEHHYQWEEEELAALVEAADAPDFLLFSGFEYSSSRGDILVYGLDARAVKSFEPYQDPERMLQKALEMGAACIAAHPTRASMGFDERIARMPFHAMEVQSVNLQPEEQRQAWILSRKTGIPGVAASDAHRVEDVGAYALEFDDDIQSVADLTQHLRQARFRIAKTPCRG